MWGSAHQLMLVLPEALDRRGQVILGFGEPGCQKPATRREPLESVFHPKAGRADSVEEGERAGPTEGRR
eukprot:1014793-Alexandrium_andersonii.AAC.1